MMLALGPDDGFSLLQAAGSRNSGKQGSGYTKAITVRATSSVLCRPLYQKVICKLRNTLLKYERDMMMLLVHWQNYNDVITSFTYEASKV